MPPGFEYNEHYAIIILGMAEAAPPPPRTTEREVWEELYEAGQEQMPLPDYLAARNDEATAAQAGTGAKGTTKRTIL